MMQEARKGIIGLQSSYNEDTKKWNQAHTQGAYVITQFIMQNQKSKVLTIERKKTKAGKDDFYIALNATLFQTEGHELISKMLHTFQVYKSFGDIEAARKFYAKYSAVTEKELQLKRMLESESKSQSVRLFQNIDKEYDGCKRFDCASMNPKVVPTLKNYQKNFIGIISSFIDRYPFNKRLVDTMLAEWMKTKDFIRVPHDDYLDLSQQEKK